MGKSWKDQRKRRDNKWDHGGKHNKKSKRDWETFEEKSPKKWSAYDESESN